MRIDRPARFALLLVLLSACAETRSITPLPPPPPPPLEKITALQVRLPQRGELPPVAGRMQEYRIVPKDTLLDVARNAGLGFQEVKDANRDVDEWIPPVGLDVVVPTRWILPRTSQHGIVVNIPEMRMYLYPQRTKPGQAVRVRTWAVAIGSDDTPSPVGSFTVTSKDKNPTWYVPDSIYRTMRRPRHVFPPGPDNPMGAYRIRISKGLYSIHGTDIAWAIGRETTHGCIRLYPEDIGELYALIKPSMGGAMVYEPVKIGAAGDRIYVEVHDDVYHRVRNLEREAQRLVREEHLTARVDPERLRQAVRERRGIPVDVTRDVPAIVTQSPGSTAPPSSAAPNRSG
jgi:L,D-transpeptidase ErfK/SrfK